VAGFNRAFIIGGDGGFMGSDGNNPILFQVLIGDASRKWLEVFYVDRSIRPLGKVRRLSRESLTIRI
jgi:hypothetical protein